MKKMLIGLVLVVAVLSIPAQAMMMSRLSLSGWGGTPTIATIADPNTGAPVEDGMLDPRLCLAQTFRVLPTETALKLDKIAIWESGGPPTQNPYTLRLVDLGNTDPTYQGGGSQSYNKGTDLWGGNMTFNYYGDATPGSLEFNFQGAEEKILTAGHYYAFEITASTPVGGIWWYRANAAGSTYANGAEFVDTIADTPGVRNQLFSGSNGRDLAMAIYLVSTPEPATVVMLSLGGLILLKKRGNG